MNMGSPTPSLDSINGTHSLGSLIDQNDYQSLSSAHSPLTGSPNSLSSASNGSSNNIIVGSLFSSIMGLGGNGSTAISSQIHAPQLCGLCHDTFTNPKILPCLHTFCEPCLERTQQYQGKVTCVRCHQECILPPGGVHALLTDYSIFSEAPATVELNPNTICTNCKNHGAYMICYCYDCNHYLCQECTVAHKLVYFDTHRLYSITEDSAETQDGLMCGERKISCTRHKMNDLRYFCLTCNVPICKECIASEHSTGVHDFELISDVGPKQLEYVNQLAEDSKAKAGELRSLMKSLNHAAGKLQVQFHKAQNEVHDTFLFYRSMLEERKQEILKELESLFSAKQLSINVVGQKAHDTVEKIYQVCEFVERLFRCTSVTECMVFKKMLDTKLQNLVEYLPEISLQTASELDFMSNYQAIQVGVRNTFGYIRSNGEETNPTATTKQPPIARPTNGSSSAGPTSGGGSSFMMNSNGTIAEYLTNGLSHTNGGLNGSLLNSSVNGCSLNGLGGTGAGAGAGTGGTSLNGSLSGSMNGLLMDKPYANGIDMNGNGSAHHLNGYDSGILSKRFNDVNECNFSLFNHNNNNNNNTINVDLNLGGSMSSINTIGGCYEKWSNGGGDIFQNGSPNNEFSIPSSNNNNSDDASVIDLTARLLTTSLYPPKSQIKRQKMIYHCKFGEFGAMESQFTEPSGVAVNAQNDIIVADTNNHRIQIFDKDGRYKFQFGECGKRDGQLLYPNRVAVIKHTGDIIVTERSPTHQIQIYNQYGQFVRKFGATILQHPRGITVDNKGRIIVVECKVMRVIIFDQLGNVLQKFGCSKHLEFPNGVVVNDRQEIFISDNRAHCVKVFNYDGMYLRQIGNEGVTNYPIGVGINSAGDILIADNHNNFNLTIFTQDGQLVSALESKVKHAQCFDVALMDDGSVVLASKDYRLYIYRYLQIPPIGI